MKKTYQIRSFWLSALFALLGLTIIVQVLRIQNSPEAAVFLQQGVLSAVAAIRFGIGQVLRAIEFYRQTPVRAI